VTAVPDRLATALADRYRIERELGQGGMATVYLAHDVRHDRNVALKVLRPELSAILGAERFLAEIKTTANLPHPHILPLHDSGEADGLVFYVMPFIEGESLRDRLRKEKQLPVEAAVRIATQVAGALDYAHRHGVVHRDIKPENILLHDGSALVADFGIALAVSRSDGGTRMTETGMSLGTPHYMSPEQAMGEREITAKSDVYALGCVLYEMLVGEPPFTGPTAQAIVAKVMTAEVPGLTAQRRTIPPHVDAAVRQALAKLPADRFASAAAFAHALTDPGFTGITTAYHGAVARALPARLRPAALAAVGLLGAALGASAVVLGRRPAPPAPALRFYVSGDSARSITRSFALSPDGTVLVYRAVTPSGSRLFAQRLSELEPRPIPGTEDAVEWPGAIFFAPDGATIGFWTGTAIKRVRLDGSDLRTVATLTDGFGGADWTTDGSIVYGAFKPNGLYRVSAEGGTPSPIPARGADSTTFCVLPQLLPGGRTLLCLALAARARIVVFDLAAGTFTPVANAMSPRYLPSGYLVFGTTDGSVMLQPFDAGRRDTSGPAVRVAEKVATLQNVITFFDVSPSGVLVTVPRGTAGAVLQLLRGDGGARVLARGRFWVPRFSPDGRRIAYGAYVSDTSALADLWSYDLVLGNDQRLTSGGSDGKDYNDPVWSPDGRRLALSASDSTALSAKNLYVMPGDASGPPALLLERAGNQWPTDWTRDGREILFTDVPTNGSRSIWVVPIAQPAQPRPVVQSRFNASGARLSPDGRWLAFDSDETGQLEVYVQPFPGPGRRLRVSSAGGQMPVWSRSGRELYFWSGGRIVAVSMTAGTDLAIGAPRPLFAANLADGTLAQYDAHPDGSRFVTSEDAVGSIRLVVSINGLPALQR